jgi:hypothetical protein
VTAIPGQGLCQVIELAFFYASQERGDFRAGIHQNVTGRVTRVAYGHLAGRQRRELDAIPAGVALDALPPNHPRLLSGYSVAGRHRFLPPQELQQHRTSDATQITSLLHSAPAQHKCNAQLTSAQYT